MIQILHAIMKGASIEEAINMMSDKDKETMRSLLPFVKNVAERGSKEAVDRFKALQNALNTHECKVIKA